MVQVLYAILWCPIVQDVLITAAEELRITNICKTKLTTSATWKACGAKFAAVKEIEKTYDTCVQDIKVGQSIKLKLVHTWIKYNIFSIKVVLYQFSPW